MQDPMFVKMFGEPHPRRLEPPDSLHFQAAQGWLELGNPIEANEELEKVTASLRAHPDVLKVRWEIYAAAKKWEAALDISDALVQLEPEDPLGWAFIATI